jgi:uncharacterized damage-inducible protein DinB
MLIGMAEADALPGAPAARHNPSMSRYDFLIDTYRTERLKTLSLWSQVPDVRLDDRLEPRARSPREHMVHQCQSEDTWMRTMFGIVAARPALPAEETRVAFLDHYAAASQDRLAQLAARDAGWFEEEIDFFDVRRSRAWAFTRRLTHSTHHRGQLQACLRAWGLALYSNYGPTADTGGLAANGGRVVYRYESVAALLAGEASGGSNPPLPGPGEQPVSERPPSTRASASSGPADTTPSRP